MRFLLTNDDGIDSIFLHELIAALKLAGHDLCVVAPKTEQSWIGAAKSRHRTVTSAQVDRGFGCPTWTVDGTPSDCVSIALAHLLPGAGLPMPEAVVSGINVGFNISLGFILASGTIGGAWEGALHGLPAAALSQDLTFEAFDALKVAGGAPDAGLLATLRMSARRAAALLPALLAATPSHAFTVHNLNFPFPCSADCEVLRSVPARMTVPGLFSPPSEDGTHHFVFSPGEDHSPAGLLTDRAALARKCISHTVLDYRKLGA